MAIATLERAATKGLPASEISELRRDVGLVGLTWTSVGSMIGSGWLFGAFAAATIAGPAALIAWGIGAAIVMLLALVHSELGTMFPVSGGAARFQHFAFGSFAGATFGWFAYVQAAAVAPIEVLAAIEYLSSASWAKGIYNTSHGALSGIGVLVAAVLMVVFVLVNLVGVRWLARTNNGITSWKVLVPLVTGVVLLISRFHGGNFSAVGGFFTHGPDGGAHSILEAVAGGGIVFSLLGFEQAIQIAGESSNPRHDLPRAVIGSTLIGAAIYLFVQFAFIGALDPSMLARAHSWSNLTSDAGLAQAPFYTLAKVSGLAWLAWTLRLDAVVSPAGTGLVYLTAASRVSHGLSQSGYFPRRFSSLGKRANVPTYGVLFASAIGMVFLLPFPSWNKLVGVVTGASVLMYAGAPLALGALRLSRPDDNRPYKIPAGRVFAPVTFVLANFIVYWAGWQTMSTLMALLVGGYGLMTLSRLAHLNDLAPRIDWRSATWIVPYFVGMTLISYFGSFGSGGIIGGVGPFKNVLVGGAGHLRLWWDLGALTIFSVAIYLLAMRQRLTGDEVFERSLIEAELVSHRGTGLR